MGIATTKQYKLIVLSISFLLIVSLYFLTKTTYFSNNINVLSKAVLVDLLLVIPLIYFFLIRKKSIPNFTVVSLVVFGLFFAGFILPENQQSLLSEIKIYAIPVLELFIFSFILLKVRKTRKEFKSLRTNKNDFFDTIKTASLKSFPKKVAYILSTEIAVFYYGFFIWKRRVLKENEFTIFKENALQSLLFALLLVIFVETFVLHRLLENWNITFAWILSIVSIYTALQVFALIKSLPKRPIVIDKENEELLLRFGFFSQAIIPFRDIDKTIITSDYNSKKEKLTFFSPLNDFGGYNLILHLSKEIEFETLYGFKKRAKVLAIQVDNKQKFSQIITKEISNY